MVLDIPGDALLHSLVDWVEDHWIALLIGLIVAAVLLQALSTRGLRQK